MIEQLMERFHIRLRFRYVSNAFRDIQLTVLLFIVVYSKKSLGKTRGPFHNEIIRTTCNLMVQRMESVSYKSCSFVMEQTPRR